MMQRARLSLAVAAAIVLGAGLFAGAAPAAAAPGDCEPDCGGDGGAGGIFSGALAHSGTSTVYTPGGSGGGGSTQSKYEWRVVEDCRGTNGQPGRGNCQRHIDPCDEEYDDPTGDYGAFRIDYRPIGGGVWTTSGYGCWESSDEVTTIEEIGERAIENWEAHAPVQEPSIQPPGGRAVTQLPVYFHSGQPRTMPPTSLNVDNFDVVVRASGEWIWEFEPDVSRSFRVPGSRYGDDDPQVVYTYTTPGDRAVSLQTRWWGEYTVNGEGPWEIESPASQGPTTIELNVVELSPLLRSWLR